MVKKCNEPTYGFIFKVGILITMGVILLGAVVLLVDDVEVNMDIKCNTGFIGLDYKGEGVVQQFPCKHNENLTCFKEDVLVKTLDIKNIDSANCDIKIKAKGSPLGFLLAG